MSRFSHAVLIVLLLAGATAVGQDEASVFGTTTVPDRSSEARSRALPAALADALRRLGPEDDPGGRVDAAAALAADETLLQRFEYEQVTRATASGIPSIRLMLRTWFRTRPATELLVRAGVPVWRGGGVDLTLWLVDETDTGRALPGAAARGAQDLVERLEPRGVRVHWPLHDLDDIRMVESLEPETAAEALAEAARRSAADPAVLAWARHGEEGTGIDWRVAGGDGEPAGFASSGGDLAEALADGVPRLLAVLADRHAVRPSSVTAASGDLDRGAGEYVFWLAGLDRAGSYAEAVALLTGQVMVASLRPEQADGDRVRVRVQLTAPLAQLLALLEADGRLRLSDTPPGDADLSLHWRE